MALRINTNISSLQAQRHLGNTDLNVKKTLERLSTGLRLNRSADGSAEMAVSSKLETQAKGIHQAIENAHFGINYLRTGDYGLNTMAGMVQRIRELVIQAANDSYTADDRKKIQEEIDQIKYEIDRVATTTEFNGQKIFNLSQERIDYLLKDRLGGKADISFVLDNTATMAAELANVASGLASFITSLQAQKIDFRISISIINTGAAGSGGDNVDSVNTLVDSTSNVALLQATLSGMTTLSSVIDQYNALLEVAGLGPTGADALAGPLDTFAGTDTATRRANVRYFQVIATDINGPEVVRGSFPGPAPGNTAAREACVANILATNGVTVYGILNGAAAPAFDNILAATGGSQIPMLASGAFGGGGLQGIADAIAQSVTNPGELLVDKGAIQIQVGPNEGNMIGLDRPHLTYQSLGLLNVDVTRPGLQHFAEGSVAIQNTAQSFDNMILQCDNALENIAQFRTNFGAIENRLTATVDRLGVSEENTRAALSRIKDADFAAETAHLTKNQIMQQAGTAVLSQANVTPQNALRLLQG